MKFPLLFLSLALLQLLTPNVHAHTYLSNIDGLAETDCIRPQPPSGRENPIPLVTAADMTCGWLPYSAQAANRKCPIAAGSTVTMQWHHENDLPTDDIIDPSHHGPCLVYMAKSDSGAGSVWFKIYENGWNPTTAQWCVDTLIANKGVLTFTIPSDISPGNYLLRGEILALHAANVLNGCQPYVGCAEITVTGGGSANPAGVMIPGVYSPTDPGIFFDIYNPFTSYPIPGPPVYVAGSSTAPTTTTAPATTHAPTTARPTTTSKATQSQPTASPTASNAPSANGVIVQLYPSSGAYWVGVAVESNPATSKIELMDSRSTTWATMQATNWGYWVYTSNSPLDVPLSLRLTSSANTQLVLTNVFTSWTVNSNINTGKSYPGASSRSVHESPSTIKAQLHEGSNAWWVGIDILESKEDIDSVILTDSSMLSDWEMKLAPWGYWIFTTPTGDPIVAPLKFTVISTRGAIVDFEIDSLGNSTLVNTHVQF